MNSKYAIIHYSELLDSHINLIRATGVNTTRESVLRSRSDVVPEVCLLEWDDDIAQGIPEAVAAIQQMADAGVEFLTEAQACAYMNDPTSPFYPTDLP